MAMKNNYSPISNLERKVSTLCGESISPVVEFHLHYGLLTALDHGILINVAGLIEGETNENCL